jgi:hypothetical protein
VSWWRKCFAIKCKEFTTKILRTGLDNHKRWNHRVGFAAAIAHHIIIGILLPNLEYEMKQVKLSAASAYV